MTIDELIELQARINSGHVHVVWLGEDEFTIAHTDWEREEGFDAILDCDLTDWLESFEEAPGSVGIYAAFEDPGVTGDGWELIPVELEWESL